MSGENLIKNKKCACCVRVVGGLWASRLENKYNVGFTELKKKFCNIFLIIAKFALIYTGCDCSIEIELKVEINKDGEPWNQESFVIDFFLYCREVTDS